jgi:hypothetical protein
MTRKAYQITVPAVPPGLNITKRLHWRLLGELKERWWVLIRNSLVSCPIPAPTGRRRVDVIVWTCAQVEQDHDNFVGGCKEVITDNLKPAKAEICTYRKGPRAGQKFARRRIGHGLILEDNSKWLEWGDFRQIQVHANGEERTSIILTDCDMGMTAEQRRDEVATYALRARGLLVQVLAEGQAPGAANRFHEAAQAFLNEPLPGALQAYEVSNA